MSPHEFITFYLQLTFLLSDIGLTGATLLSHMASAVPAPPFHLPFPEDFV